MRLCGWLVTNLILNMSISGGSTMSEFLFLKIQHRFNKLTPGEYYGAMHLLSILEPLLAEADVKHVLKVVDSFDKAPARGYTLFGKAAPKFGEPRK